jgi:multidrug resistance efflux pump
VGKHTDQIGKIEDYQAPWETAAGETEIDKAKLKRYIFNLVTDKAKAQDARDEAAEKVTEAEKNLKDAKDEVAKGDPTGKIADLETKLAKAEADATKAQGDLDRLTVGIEKGLTPKQAARLQGETKEDLEKDADEILETFGVKPATQETDEEREEREEREAEEAEVAAEGRQSPRIIKNFINPNDSKNGSAELDYDKIAGQIMSPGVRF